MYHEPTPEVIVGAMTEVEAGAIAEVMAGVVVTFKADLWVNDQGPLLGLNPEKG